MTDRELKRMIKNAYDLPITENEKSFIRRYEKRSLQIFDVIKLELEYMRLTSILMGAVWGVFIYLAYRMKDTDTMWVCSSLIPFCAVIPIILLSKSERYKMDEIEASCRFSLRFIKLVRMCIIGVFALGLLLGAGIIMKVLYSFTIIDYTVCVITPYLVSDYGAMLVTRRWHGKGNIFGVLAVCIVSSLVPSTVKMFRQTGILPDAVIVAIAGILLVAIIRESLMYIKESENVSWNLC